MLSCDAAEREYVRCVYNLATNLKHLEEKRKYERRALSAAYEKWILSQPMDEPIRVPRKDFTLFNDWLEEMRRHKFRYKFFVVTGPSWAGKTIFLKLSMPGNTFMCTCKNAEEPDLRSYVGPPFHDNILYDEAGPKLVETHRDLFQSPRHKVTLGHSGTNCYAYDVFVYKVRMAIATNDWWGQLSRCSEEAQDWLRKNSVVLDTEALAQGESLYTAAELNSTEGTAALPP